MHRFSLSHLSDETLAAGLTSAAARERVSTAELVAHIAEFDARGLYRRAGYPSMFHYCEGHLGLSRDAAFKRITAARAAIQYPTVFEALADGRLHLAAVNQLSAHLTEENAGDLLAAAFHKTKAEIDQMLAERFPRTEWMPLVEAGPLPDAPREEASSAEMSCPLAPGASGIRPEHGEALCTAALRSAFQHGD